mmetsp:Transcript_9518/g.11417  ORF Transcript_9518/g.11417 Transcript_9518/m.11417 type:complete len:332 (+) Transcript_9518:413-1408(+)
MVAFPSFLYHQVPKTLSNESRISYAFDYTVSIPKQKLLRNPFPMDLFTTHSVITEEAFSHEKATPIDRKNVSSFGSITLGQRLVYGTKVEEASIPAFSNDLCDIRPVEMVTAKTLLTPVSWPPHSMDRVVPTYKNRTFEMDVCKEDILISEKNGTSHSNEGGVKMSFLTKGILDGINEMLPRLSNLSQDPFMHTYIKKKLILPARKDKIGTDDIQITAMEHVQVQHRGTSEISAPNPTEIPRIAPLSAIPLKIKSSNSVCDCNSLKLGGIMSVSELVSSSGFTNTPQVCGLVFNDDRMKDRYVLFCPYLIRMIIIRIQQHYYKEVIQFTIS